MEVTLVAYLSRRKRRFRIGNDGSFSVASTPISPKSEEIYKMQSSTLPISEFKMSCGTLPISEFKMSFKVQCRGKNAVRLSKFAYSNHTFSVHISISYFEDAQVLAVIYSFLAGLCVP